jgi:hypothetical protein
LLKHGLTVGRKKTKKRETKITYFNGSASFLEAVLVGLTHLSTIGRLCHSNPWRSSVSGHAASFEATVRGKGSDGNLIDRQGLETVVNLGRAWVCQLPMVEKADADAEKYTTTTRARDAHKVYSLGLRGLIAVKRAEL